MAYVHDNDLKFTRYSNCGRTLTTAEDYTMLHSRAVQIRVSCEFH